MIIIAIIVGIGIILTPIIGARLIGLIWGGLLKLGMVGRIITTLITAIPFVIVVFFLSQNSAKLESSLLLSIVATVLFGITLLIPIIYFFWHYFGIEDMGALEFSQILKNVIVIAMIGLFIGIIVATFNETAGVLVMGAGVVVGLIYYFISLIEATSGIGSESKFRWVSIIVAIGITVVVGIPIITKANMEIAARMDAMALEAGQIAVVKARGLYLKETPSPWSKSIGTLMEGTEVMIIGEIIKSEKSSDNFIQVEYEGKTGYLDVHYLRRKK